MPKWLDLLLAEQSAYYRAVTVEYRQRAIRFPGEDELSGALDEFGPSERVLA